MALFKFFKSLFSRGKKKKPAKRRHSAKKKIKRIKRKISHAAKKKPQKKFPRKQTKRPKKIKAKSKKKIIKKAALRSIKPSEKEIGVITHYFDKISVGIIKLKEPLAISELIHIKGNSTDFTQVISSMQHNHKDITFAGKGLEIGIKVNKPARENDIVYRVI